jgi:DNA-binding winged helix-turn-helix (wHTH) protein
MSKHPLKPRRGGLGSVAYARNAGIGSPSGAFRPPDTDVAVNPNRATCVNPPYPGGYLIGDLVIEPRLRRIRHPDGELELTQRVFDLLLVFVTEPFTLHARETLFERVWGTLHIEDTNLTQTISVLRKALGEPRKHWIKTVSRTGYSFEPPCEVRYVDDLREQSLPPAAMPLAENTPASSLVDARLAAPAMRHATPASISHARIATMLLLAFALLSGLATSGSSATLAQATDAGTSEVGLDMSIVITEPAGARSDAERRATRLLREWVRWKLSRIPSIDLVEEQDLIAGRATTSYFLDLSATPQPDGDIVLDIGFRPVYLTKSDATDPSRRRVRVPASADGLPATVDTASAKVLAIILPHRQRDRWPVLDLDPATADRFAEAAAASRTHHQDAQRLLEDVVRSAPEFAAARQLLAREMAGRRQFRQAAEQAELGRALATQMPADAATLLEAETAALTRMHADRALALYAQLSAACPKRMDFVLAQATILLHNSEPEPAFQLLSRAEWERVTGSLRIRQRIAHAESAFMLGYLDKAEQSANDAIERIEYAPAGRAHELGAARLVHARMWGQKYQTEDQSELFAKAAEAFDAADHPLDATAARFYQSLYAFDIPAAEARLVPLLESARAHGDHVNEIWPQRMMAFFRQWNGDHAGGVRMLESALQSAGLAGDVASAQLLDMDLLQLNLLEGDLAKASRRIERLRDNRLWTKYRYRAARFESDYLILSGRYRDAVAVLDRVLGDAGRATRWDMPSAEAGDIACARMKALTHIGERDAARTQSKSCRDHNPARASLGEARIALLDGDQAAAMRHVRAAETGIGTTPDDYRDIMLSTELAALKLRVDDLSAETLLDSLHRSPAHLEYGAVLADIEVGLAEAAAARGDWPKVAQLRASVRARVPAQARHFFNRLELLDVKRLQAMGDRDAARREIARIEAIARRDGAATILAELAGHGVLPLDGTQTRTTTARR